uniref:Uncharacterized protein n=1 Tax=Rhizophora mucronata TaxID=61149 RepID=A0A2P2NHK9_RHIMU
MQATPKENELGSNKEGIPSVSFPLI